MNGQGLRRGIVVNVNEERAEMGIRASAMRRLACRQIAILAFAFLVLSGLLDAPVALGNILEFGFDQGASSTISNNAAAAHPDFETRFRIKRDPSHEAGTFRRAPWARTSDVLTELPPGMVGNPSAFPKCSMATFYGQIGYWNDKALERKTGLTEVCDSDTQVGWIAPGGHNQGEVDPDSYKSPLFNLPPPGGESEVVARLGFFALVYPVIINVYLDPKADNALVARLVHIPSTVGLLGSDNMLWGVPTDHSHDWERTNFWEAAACSGICPTDVKNPDTGEIESKVIPRPSKLPQQTPFMTNPTSCGPTEVLQGVRSYQDQDGFDYRSTPLGEIDECAAVPFEPSMSLSPTTRGASASSGLEVSVHVPQDGLTDPDGRASSHVKNAVVTLPEGFSLNASAADGLASCTQRQAGVDRAERQIVDIGGSGTRVSLSFNGQSTAVLPQFASSAEVQSALEGLPGVGPGAVEVSGRRGGPWTVDFVGSLYGSDVPEIDGTRDEAQQVVTYGSEGSFTLGFEGEETSAIPYEASAEEVAEALEALSAIGTGGVEVTREVTDGSVGGTGGPIYRVVFTGDLGGLDVGALEVTESLTGADHYTMVNPLTEGSPSVETKTIKQGGSLGFSGSVPTCPASSKIATGQVLTPVLDNPIPVNFYLAKQQDNPFNSLFAGYLVAHGEGVTLTLPAKIDVDPNTGQVVTTFEDLPQQPFEDLELRFKSGNRGAFTTPDQCGTYASTYELMPWSGNPPVKGTSEFTLDENCEAKPFAPGFHAGSETALAGSFTTFLTQVTNDAGAAALSKISVDLPEGLSAKLAGVSICSDAALASLPTAAGTGQAQIASPSCPSNSQVGTVQAGAGSGSPFYVRTGKAYLAGPYKGAPLSLAVLTPAVAGPFDLGNVLVRVPVGLDRRTARAHAASDPIPTMLSGIPLELRDVRVLLDRQGFALNPTGCEPKAVNGVIEASNGQSASVSDRFQVGECAALAFKPKLSLKLKGGTKRGDHPALTAVFRPRPGDANTSYVQVALPKSEFLDQGHIGTVCTRVQFAADQCPKASIYGKVTAQTPLLDQTLTGNVYLRSSEHELPDLVMDLRGPASQPIHLEADGRIDSIKGGIRTTFEFVPDAPINRVVLKMKGGKKGLLQNSRDICAQTFKANASFAAHNGRTLQAPLQMQARCKRSARQGRGPHKAPRLARLKARRPG